MKTITKVMALVAFAVALSGIHDTLAQQDYDVKTVETVGGKVLSIEKTTTVKRRGYWVDVMHQDEKGTILVQLGSLWFVRAHTPCIVTLVTIPNTGSSVHL